MTETEFEHDADVDPLVLEVAEGLRNARTEEGLLADLVASGRPKEDAAALVALAAQLLAVAKEDRNRRGKNLVGIGIFISLIGVYFTWVTYSGAEVGEEFVLAWGPIVFGPVQAVRGLMLLAKPL